jgi:hypothetical protein
MRFFTSIIAATSLLGLTSAFPEPTPKKLDAWDSNGWSPAPTVIADGSLAGYKHPSLFKRQSGNDLSVCGYLDGQAGKANKLISQKCHTKSAILQTKHLPAPPVVGAGMTLPISGLDAVRRPPSAGQRQGQPVVLLSRIVLIQLQWPSALVLVHQTLTYANGESIQFRYTNFTSTNHCRSTAAASPYCGVLTFGDAPMSNYICGTAPVVYELFLTPTDAAGATGTFKTPSGSFTATGTVVNGGSGASGTFNLGSTKTVSTKGNVQTSTDDASTSTTAAASSSTTPVKTVTVVNTTPAPITKLSGLAAPVGVSGGLGFVGAAVMAVVGLF